MPQWNADAFSHNALCTLFNRFGISCLRLPPSPITTSVVPHRAGARPTPVSAQHAQTRTTQACRRARSRHPLTCLDWLQQQRYANRFGVLGTSLGSGFATFDRRGGDSPGLRLPTTPPPGSGDVVWTGQSTRHIRAAFEQRASLTQDQVRENLLRCPARCPIWTVLPAKSPEKPRRSLAVHTAYDLTFPLDYSFDVHQTSTPSEESTMS